MSDIDDWENFEEETTTNENKIEEKKPTEEESEVIIKAKIEPRAPRLESEKIEDYEAKWSKKNADLIEAKKIEELAYEGLDEKTKAKKMEERRVLNEVCDFMGADNQKFKGSERIIKYTPKNIDKNIKLVTEKDFLDLARINIGRIKDSGKSSKFVFQYLKNTMDLLSPALDADKLDEIIKTLTVILKKRKKDDLDKKTKKASIVNKENLTISAKVSENVELKAKIEKYKEEQNKEENYDDDDFM
jgi:hypothetical protein